MLPGLESWAIPGTHRTFLDSDLRVPSSQVQLEFVDYSQLAAPRPEQRRPLIEQDGAQDREPGTVQGGNRH